MQQQQARKKQAFSQPPIAKLKLPVLSPTHNKKRNTSHRCPFCPWLSTTLSLDLGWTSWNWYLALSDLQEKKLFHMVQSNIISLPVGMFFYTPIQGCLYVNKYCCCCSVANSCPTLCDPMALQHARLPCPSLSPGVYSNPCPLIRWCHPTILFSVAPFSSCLQSFQL